MPRILQYMHLLKGMTTLSKDPKANAIKYLSESKDRITKQIEDIKRQMGDAERRYKALAALLRELDLKRIELERNLASVNYILEEFHHEDHN